MDSSACRWCIPDGGMRGRDGGTCCNAGRREAKLSWHHVPFHPFWSNKNNCDFRLFLVFRCLSGLVYLVPACHFFFPFDFFFFCFLFLGPIVLGKPGITHRKLISWWSDLRDPLWSTPGPGWIPRAHHAASLTPVQFKTVVIFQRRRGRHWPRQSSVRVRCVSECRCSLLLNLEHQPIIRKIIPLQPILLLPSLDGSILAWLEPEFTWTC